MLNYVEYGKENKYDDDIFFQKYSQMSRSQQGLAGAGEWETLRKLLPDFKDKRVLDLGCGYGWHCIYAMEHGASSVVLFSISSGSAGKKSMPVMRSTSSTELA